MVGVHGDRSPFLTVWHADRLTDRQAQFVERWLPEPRLVEDLSWGLVDTTVLHVRTAAGGFIVKAAGQANHHIGREISAHEGYTAPLAQLGAAARLVVSDRDANVLVTEYLVGEIVVGTPAELETETYARAGLLLKAFHSQAARTDQDFERLATDRALAWLDSAHRIAPEHVSAARNALGDYRPQPVTVVPTHGDWQPRNWLVDDGNVKVIDFGRFEFRPAETDLCRLAAQQWRSDSQLEAAFLHGYGTDPRDPGRWSVMMLREAIGTAAWAYQVGDESFEEQGHRMLAEALAAF